jgi:hypothetical protein
VRWLVTQELESRERHEIHLEAGSRRSCGRRVMRSGGTVAGAAGHERGLCGGVGKVANRYDATLQGKASSTSGASMTCRVTSGWLQMRRGVDGRRV